MGKVLLCNVETPTAGSHTARSNLSYRFKTDSLNAPACTRQRNESWVIKHNMAWALNEYYCFSGRRRRSGIFQREPGATDNRSENKSTEVPFKCFVMADAQSLTNQLMGAWLK